MRQGDPLSPYLFLLCVEGLSNKIKEAALLNHINGCNINPSAPAITHLLFSDDSFLFFKANEEETQEVKNLLNSYESLSGQAVNYQKPGIFFSANVRRDKQQAIRDILAVQNDLTESNNLGLPSLVGRSKKQVFNFPKERIWQRVQNWCSKLLSKAGKTVLIRNVAQSLPAFSMSCFLIPKMLCQEMERIINNYWWTSYSTDKKGIKCMAWDKMCKAKCKSGLDFRSLHDFNLALLGKHVWNFLHNPSSLVARVYKAKYFQENSILEAKKRTGGSFFRSGIWEEIEMFGDGYRWVLGNGRNIKAFQDAWLKGKRDFKVEDHHRNTIREEKVCDVYHPNAKEWDVQKIHQNFQAKDVRCILLTRIP